jgi:hypothetical protein
MTVRFAEAFGRDAREVDVGRLLAEADVPA